MKLHTLLIAAAVLPLLAACADNDRYVERDSSYYEQNQRSNDYNRSNDTFRRGQIEK